MFNITILALQPQIITNYFSYGILHKALQNNIFSLNVINIRDFGINNYNQVDDTLYGGGPGMLIRADVLGNAIDYALNNGASNNIFYVSPKGSVFNSATSKSLSKLNGITLICGNFEGIDERIIQYYNIQLLSIGDYILTKGELASLVILDSTLRNLKNVLKCEDSLREESFENNLLEYPQYTKPKIWNGLQVPSVLLSGNHQKIKQWQLQQAIKVTQQNRPDLFKLYNKKNVGED